MQQRYLYPLLVSAITALFVLSLVHGSVAIPFDAVWSILAGKDIENDTWQYIILESRLPQAVTALLSGGALAMSGLLLQTSFRNPLAAPDIFGVTSGASLAVALLTLAPGMVIVGSWGYVSTVAAAFVGACAVTAVVWVLSRMVSSSVVLIILGIMIGYLTSSAVTLLSFFATEEGVKNFAVWGMGNLGNVSTDQMPIFAIGTLLAMGCTLLLGKPLNALLMGEQYAENLGIDVVRLRRLLLAITGLLTALVTAFCGPIAFIALAVPHVARLLSGTENHHLLLPTTMLTGAVVMLACNVITALPGNGSALPINAVTPFIGAPVIIYVVMKRRV